ncbi:MAG: hypothetical protein Q4D87_03275 [Actinomycetaceae bacterium]|nr:hypothetical protein [Actinomycetaceae bacterium]
MPDQNSPHGFGPDDLLPPNSDATRRQRVTRSISTVPGRLLIRMALASSLLLLVLAAIGVFAYGTWGWWIPLIVGVAGLGITGFFALRRKLLQDAIKRSGPRTVVGEQTSIVIHSDSEGERASTEQQLHDMAQREGEKVRRAREEFQNRSARYFPRVEALQRAMKQMVDPSYDAAWLELDIRPTLVSFIATVLVIPVTGFFIVLTTFALLLSGM